MCTEYCTCVFSFRKKNSIVCEKVNWLYIKKYYFSGIKLSPTVAFRRFPVIQHEETKPQNVQILRHRCGNSSSFAASHSQAYWRTTVCLSGKILLSLLLCFKSILTHRQKLSKQMHINSLAKLINAERLSYPTHVDCPRIQ
jgi:hypothetical protein